MNTRRRTITSLLRTLAIVLMATAVNSCNDDFAPDILFPGQEGDTKDQITVKCTIDGMSYETRGSVMATQHETNLNHVHLIFFSSLDESYITYVTAQVINGASGRTFSFSVPADLKQGVDYKVLVVGNGNNFIPLQADGTPYDSYGDYIAATCTGHTYSQILENEANNLTFHYDLPMSAQSTPLLPMFGKYINAAQEELPFNFEIEGDSYKVKGFFYFKRAVSRIDIKNLVTGKFQIDYVKMVNICDGGYVFHDTKCGEVQPGVSDAKPVEGVNGWMAVSPIGAEQNTQELKASLYAFPNMQNSTAANDNVTTALMIAGRYDKDTKDTYYRFNLTPVGEPLSMQRNHIYTAVIQNITGRGDATEEEAMKRETPVLSAEVTENWGDDSSVVTDNEGNYLMLSRTTVTLDGDADITEVIQVKISKGSKWRLQVDNQTGHSNDKFEFKEIDQESFAVKTLEDNTTYTLRKGYVNIIATTPQNTQLIAPFIVQQVPDEVDPKILLVENSSEDYNTTIAGTGGRLQLRIQTGSLVEGWKVKEVVKKYYDETDEDGNKKFTYEEISDTDLKKQDLNTMTRKFKNVESSTYTSKGSHLGHLIMDISANITKEDREICLKVEREIPENDKTTKIDPIYINIVQPKSEYLVSVFPYPENGTLFVEGFEPNASINAGALGNGISAQPEFFVSLANQDHYTYEVTSTFDKNRDLRLSALRRLDRWSNNSSHPTIGNPPTPNKQIDDKLSNLYNGQKFYLNVYSTGPGDPNIDGEITVRAVPDDPSKYESQEITFHVTIVTSCTIDDVFVSYSNNWIVVADRNAGAKPRLDDKKAFVPALNFTMQPGVHINGYGDINKTDNDNADFRGEVYQYSSSNDENWVNSLLMNGNQSTDPNRAYEEFTEKNLDDDELYSSFYHKNDKKWMVPNIDHWEFYIKNNIRWSKQRCFILSAFKDLRNGGDKYVGCYLPMSTTSGVCYYMTSTQRNGSRCYLREIHSTTLDAGSYQGRYDYKTYKQYYWRPIRPVTENEINAYKAKFLGYK